jgi:hypothetical protein
MFGIANLMSGAIARSLVPAATGAVNSIFNKNRNNSYGGFTGMGRGLSGLTSGTYDFGGGFRDAYDPVTSAQSVGRRPKRINTGMYNDRDLRTAPRPDAPMLTRQVPEEYQELVDYQDPDYFNYVRNTPDLRKAFEATPEAKELAKAAWDDQTGKIDTEKFDGDAYRDAAIKFGETHYNDYGEGEGRDLPMIDRQRYETKERMIDELYEGPRPDREQLFDTARNAIQNRLYNNMGRQREFNPYSFDSYSPSRRGMSRGPLNMGLDSMFGGMFRNSSPYGMFPGFGGGMQPFNPYGGGFGRRGMFGGMQQQAPFGGMFGGMGRGLGGMFGGMSGGLFGPRQKGGISGIFGRSTPGMGGAMDPFMTPRGGRGMFGAMNDIARRGMQANQDQMAQLGGGLVQQNPDGSFSPKSGKSILERLFGKHTQDMDINQGFAS